jgi:molybdopterin-guanine dinucleotide biosynthesis protein A
MGTNKALLRFDDGTTVIERIVRRVSPLCRELLLVTNTPEEYAFLGLPMFPDALPGASSLGGIYTGLLHSSCDRTLMLSCDLPLLDAQLLAYLLELPFDYDLLIPFVEGRQQPLHAIYSHSCLDAIRRQIESGDLKIVRLLETLNGRKVDIEGPWQASFTNMNTPEDWEPLRSSHA